MKISKTLITNATTKGQKSGGDEEAAAKFRRVRLANAKIKAAIVDVPGNVELMLSVGFQLFPDEETGEDLLVFPPAYPGPDWLPTALRKMEREKEKL